MNTEKYLLPEEKSSARMEICKKCDNFIKMTHMCGKCMCFMPMKVKLAPASCPDNKWLHETINTVIY